ncbi:MAG: phosphodiester glycosidase family protein [Armatimonadota bacterium]
MRFLLIVLLLAGLDAAHAASPDTVSPLANWPWPQAYKTTPHPGVTQWTDRSSPDHTVLYLLDFDFAANPNLRLELYDQDEDDAVPYDNKIIFRPRGVGQVARDLNAGGRGKVVAAWNGAFFGLEGQVGHHVAAVVLNGKVHANVGHIRWTAGVQYRDGKPLFKTLHQPDRKTLAAEFTYAAAGVQCLIREGQSLKLQPYPQPGDKPLPQPVPSTPQEAGHIPTVDHIKTTRTAMGWSKDNAHLYLLVVQEPDDEFSSIETFLRRKPGAGGWNILELQRFWRALGAWGAVNLDGGVVTQMTCLRKDGNYLLIPPAWASDKQEMILPPSFKNAPKGGTIMYFYVRDTTAK